MTKEQYRAKLFKYRSLLDELIKLYNLTNESTFNSNAVLINEKIDAFRIWQFGTSYKRGDIRIDPMDGIPYWAMHDHTSVDGQELIPHLSPTIWTHCHGTTPETARPFVAEGHNPYMEGHYCIENDKTYRCKQNNIVYAPSAYPIAWEEI